MEAQSKHRSFAEKLGPLRKSRRLSKSRMPDVGAPTDFKHILHVGAEDHHVDISSVPPEWKDILEIARHCQELDFSSNSSTDSGPTDKPKEKPNEKPTPEEKVAEFKSDIDLFADLEQSLSADYKKFLFG